MNAVLRLIVTLGVGGALATSWISVAVLARLSDAVYLPQAIRFVGDEPPEVLSPGCVGCGVCQLYCPTEPKAITVRPYGAAPS